MDKTLTPFEQALLDATLEEFADIPNNEDDIDVTFSPEFIAKSEKLIQNTQKRTWRYVNTTMKRVALVAIIAALLATTAMAIPAVREEIIRFSSMIKEHIMSFHLIRSRRLMHQTALK